MYNRPYRFEFSDTAPPEHYTLLSPDSIIICYDISDRRSLVNAQYAWRKEAIRHYNLRREGIVRGEFAQRGTEDIPVMLLGLKRDLRVEGEGTIYPQEGHRVAQEMRCDRYAECSAVTGELMNQVFEDIAKVAAKTTTEDGALSQGGCSVM